VRRLAAFAGFAGGLAAATVFYRRTAHRQRERVDLYFGDGSMVSLGEGTSGADELLPLARSILSAARSS
jgi:hypothetical protein